MKSYYIYDKTTGEILGNFTYNAPETIVPDLEENQAYNEGTADDSEFYIVDGIPTPRPTMEVVVSGLSITNIPPNATVIITTPTSLIYAGKCDDGVIELIDADPDTFNIQLSGFPYKDMEITIDANTSQ